MKPTSRFGLSRRTEASLVILALLLAAVYFKWCANRDVERVVTEPAQDVPVAVEVTPASVSLPVGGIQQFSAVGQYGDGTSAEVLVTWSATGGTMSPSGLYTAGGTTGTYRVIAAIQEGAIADTSTVTVATTYVVEVSGVPAGQEKWLLQDSGAGGNCPSDVVSRFADQELPVDDPAPGCATEFAVFASGFAPTLDPSPLPVLISGQEVFAENLAMAWEVELNVIGEYPLAIEDAKAEILLASNRYGDNRMGATFVLAASTLFDPLSLPQHPMAKGIKSGCTATAAVPGVILPGRLTVVYVRAKVSAGDEEQWPFGGKTGYDCAEEGIPGLIFILQHHAPSILAHEIGHAMSLAHAGAGAGLLAGWPANNLMRPAIWPACSTDPCPDAPVMAFSLGQAYRANFNTDSWLNLDGPRIGASKKCQAIWATADPGNPTNTAPSPTWPCPLMQLDWQ